MIRLREIIRKLYLYFLRYVNRSPACLEGYYERSPAIARRWPVTGVLEPTGMAKHMGVNGKGQIRVGYEKISRPTAVTLMYIRIQASQSPLRVR
uniref:Uncharacterized protein n=1 Tax=Candidatus Kentrum eta TaxID=2126337 RepID=A0A450VG90_9GAMM|nr:MAG: hypothetical protein BECKH772B_GA0070898_103823 [Candidatus Kentron sp. H]VFK04251.1 MAG: hypothetical protein BECKH772A_GA0070896_103953 [Candidatus Kentron sp. H]VFK06939.1 MAG: hypothetical protein BECKH772C_GA0070978_103853 [Candidatus Kentron sp. H]